MESYALLALEIIAAIIKNVEDLKANPESLTEMIAKATAAKAALVGVKSDLAANDAQADQNLADRFKP